MRISSKGDYGIRALIELAHRYGEGRLTQSAEIAARQNIPESYLEQLLAMLRRAGLVRSVRGPQGGHALARHPNEIRVSDVIRALEGELIPVECLEEASECSRAGGCAQREMWEEVQRAIMQVLDRVTIAELAAKDRQRAVRADRYVI
ncbi:MAG: Rrf2 family transcriptional regulator [Dehalococcoidia bacterium]|jgi:Rrf2 family protein|nr:Rrf2 family transcriptional regulator [Dehalococcoidia bacterium]